MRKPTTSARWDPADHLTTERQMAAYLEAALDDGDARIVAAALGDIARAVGMSTVARETGLGRESLYKALSDNGNPELGTVLRVLRAVGLRLQVREPAPAHAAVGERAAKGKAAARAVGLGSSRLAQLAADLRLSPAERARAAEETARAVPRNRKGRVHRVIAFDRYEDYLDWKVRDGIGG
jgi:probable addiction module antidote protein